MTVTNISSEPFFQAVESRRTYYNLTDATTISDAKIQEIVERAVKFVPSSFNTQTSRAVVVLGTKHIELWDAVWASHKTMLKTPEEIATFEKKFTHAYKAGYGTVAFFEDQDAIDAFIKMVPGVAGPLPIFSQNTAGMVQFIVWTAFATEGLGANLQHFGQFGEGNASAIQKFLGVPAAWKSTALMPFGVPADAGAPGNPEFPKTFQPIEERVRVIA